MKNILETVIKTALFESRTVGIVKSVTQNELRAAQGKKFVWMYAVLTKRTAVPAEVLDIVYGATISNSATDEGNRVAVGPGSKFSNGEFIYVVSEPAEISDNDRRQLISVQIAPRGNAQVTNTRMIGKSPMLTQKEYDVARGKNPTLPDNSGLEATTIIQKGVTIVKQILGKDEKPEAAATPATPVTAPTTDPNVYREKNGVKVYTMAPTDPYVYAKINDVWMYAKKADFDRLEATTEYSKIFTTRLNKAGIAKVEAKFGLATANQNQDNQIDQGINNRDNVSSYVTSFKKGSVYITDQKQFEVFIYDSQNKKFITKEIVTDVSTKTDSFRYFGTSSDGKYYDMEVFNNGKPVVKNGKPVGRIWIKTSVKFKLKYNVAQKGDVLTWTADAISDGYPTYTDGGKQPTGNRPKGKATDKIKYISKNSAGTFYEVSINDVKYWVPKRYFN